MKQTVLQEYPQDYREDGLAFFFGLIVFVSVVFFTYYSLMPFIRSMVQPHQDTSLFSTRSK